MTPNNSRTRGLGTIQSLPDGRFRALRTVERRKQHVGLFDTYERALEALQNLESIRAEEHASRPEGVMREPLGIATPTVKTVALEFVKQRHTAGLHRTAEYTELHIQRSLLTHPIASLPISAVTPQHLRKWVMDQVGKPTKHNKRPARSTVLNRWASLRGTLTHAFEQGIIDTNPALGVSVPRIARTGERWTFLSKAELQRFVLPSDVPRRDFLALMFLLYTGCRTGEAWNCLKEDIDIEGDTILITRGFNGMPKSGRARRIPIFAPLKPLLIEMLESPSTSKLLLPNRYGRRRRRSSTANLRLHLQHHGIDRHVRAHDIRHTTASALVSGVWGHKLNLQEVGYLLGHSSIQMSHRYSHLHVDSIFEVAKKLVF